jgi:hypothetical protein
MIMHFTVGGNDKTDVILFMITPWSRVFLEKVIVAELVKKFLALYESFITTFTKTCH